MKNGWSFLVLLLLLVLSVSLVIYPFVFQGMLNDVRVLVMVSLLLVGACALAGCIILLALPPKCTARASGILKTIGKRIKSFAGSSFFRYIVRRLLYMIPVAIGVSIITFVTMYAAGDPINLISLGRNLNAQTKDALRVYYGLNNPVPLQYLNWLANILRLNFGKSFTFGADVNTLIGNWILYTIELQILSLVIAFLIAIPIGINSAKNQYSKGDLVVTSVSLFGVSMPTFWLGAILIIVFSFTLGWLPSSGAVGPSYAPWWGNPILDHIAHLILPTLVLVYVTLAQNIRLIRANMLEVLRSDYILAARASGISERKIIYRYALKNAITPTITFLGIALGAMVGGAPMTEFVFNWPGLGRRFVSAVNNMDFPVIMAITMIITIMTLIANLIVDVIYVYFDPRIRLK